MHVDRQKLNIRGEIQLVIAYNSLISNPIIITGMHRSGTSMVAQLLHKLGVYLGEEDQISNYKPEENPDGFWEDPRIFTLNDKLLAKLNSSWDSLEKEFFQFDWKIQGGYIEQYKKNAEEILLTISGGNQNWGFKDPRTMILLPFWKTLCPNAKYILLIRNPLEVAFSLSKRFDNFVDISNALRLWRDYYDLFLEYIGNSLYLISHYESYFYDPEKETKRLLEFVGLKVSSEKIQKISQEVIKSNYYRGVVTKELFEDYKEFPVGLLNIYSKLKSLSGNVFTQLENDPEYQVALERTVLKRLFKSSGRALLSFKESVKQLEEKEHEFEEENIKLRQEIAEGIEQRAELHEKIINYEEKTQYLIKSIEELETKKTELHNKVIEFEENNQKLSASLDEKEQQNQKLNQKIKEYEEAIQQKANLNKDYELRLKEKDEIIKKLKINFAQRNIGSLRKIRIIILGLLKRLGFFIKIRKPHKFLSVPPVFDSDWYLRTYWDVAASKIHPFTHYLMYGWKEERNPNPFFDVGWYLDSNDDVKEAGVEPITHFINHGWKEGRNPSQRFNTQWYLQKYPDVASSKMDPLTHYLSFGMDEGRMPAKKLDYDWFISQYPIGQPNKQLRPEPIGEMNAGLGSVPQNKKTSDIGFGSPNKVEVSILDENIYSELLQDVSIQITRFLSEEGKYPSVLNWGIKDVKVIDIFDNCPAIDFFEEKLPYIGNSFDLVITNKLDQVGDVDRVTAFKYYLVKDENKHTVIDVTEERIPNHYSVSIIIPVFNNVSYTKRCLEGLKETLPLPNNHEIEIIIMDDGSTDETSEMIQEFQEHLPQIKYVKNENNLGFLHTCNRGAEIASNDILLFLNNDTVPQTNWIESLLDTFYQEVNAGVVGGKLIFPDGRLQEAGSVLFRNGEGYNFGMGEDNPEFPLYNHLREVDYCSGALLATPRQLFMDLGKFSEEFAPAYYEDSDYCMKVKSVGKKIYYQPNSVVIHDHHASYSKTNLPLILEHREAFIKKWSGELSDAPISTNGKFNRSIQYRLVAPQKKRFLLCGHILPYYDVYGGAIRPYNILLMMREAGWHVSYFSVEARSDDERYIERLAKQGIPVYSGSYSHLAVNRQIDFVKLVSEGNFDTVMINSWEVAKELVPLAKEFAPNSTTIVDTSDLYFQRISRLKATNNELLDKKFGQDMMEELNIYATADGTLGVSPRETQVLSDLLGTKSNAFFLPNIINQMNFEQDNIPFEERKGIVIVGFYYYPPNSEMVKFFLDKIYPHISKDTLKQHPVYIVGGRLPDELKSRAKKLDRSGNYLRVTGWVPTIPPYRKFARIMAAPLLSGSGTKSKVIDALAAGLPTIATHIGAEDLGLEDGTHILIEDDPKKFAFRLEDLLHNKTLWERLRTNGQELIIERHGLVTGSRQLTKIIETIKRG